MTASRIAWLVGVGAGAVLVVLALGAAAVVPIGPFVTTHNAPPASGPNGWNATNRTSYPVSFTESGLPNGTFWSVSLRPSWSGWAPSQAIVEFGHGWGWAGWNGSRNSTVGFTVGNGTYSYSIGDARNGSTVYVPTPGTGSLTVNGSGASVAISFSPLTFSTVSFVESGLPAGTNWSVLVHSVGSWGPGWGGGWGRGQPVFAWNGSANSTLNFSLANGPFVYRVGPVWTASALYVPTPGSGNFTVNGSALSVSISFAAVPLSSVTFNETGLPNGTAWGASLFNWSTGTFVRGWSNSTSLSLSVPNGTYDFGIGPVWNASGLFFATPHFGNVTVDGATVVVDVQFTLYTPSWQVAGTAS